MNKKKLILSKSNIIFYLVCSFIVTTSNQSFAQDAIIKEDVAVRSSLYNFSYTEFNLDFYKFNSTQYLLSQTGNGTLKVNEKNYINFEYIISNAWLNNSNYIVPGDFSFSYIHSFYAKNYLSSGFQGVSATIKMILPTGKLEYLSGLDNWIIEPSIYFGWKLRNDNIYFAHKLRAIFSISALPETPKIDPYGRYEAILGYENDKFWIASTSDSRLTLNDWDYVLLLKLEYGLKLNKSNGIFTSVTYRVFGELFYEYYLNFGYYKTF